MPFGNVFSAYKTNSNRGILFIFVDCSSLSIRGMCMGKQRIIFSTHNFCMAASIVCSSIWMTNHSYEWPWVFPQTDKTVSLHQNVWCLSWFGLVHSKWIWKYRGGRTTENPLINLWKKLSFWIFQWHSLDRWQAFR